MRRLDQRFPSSGTWPGQGFEERLDGRICLVEVGHGTGDQCGQLARISPAGHFEDCVIAHGFSMQRDLTICGGLFELVQDLGSALAR